MIGLSLPATGAPFGWSVATGELISAFQDLTDTYIITDACPKSIHGIPVLHAVAGVNMLPLRPQFWSAVRNIGYCFCEDNLTLKKYLRAARAFDAIVCGSTWGTEVFRSYGFESISVAIQGVAPEFFEVPPRQDVGQFVVFSGGKAEYRKGQDVAVKAMKIFMSMHKDVWLSRAWHNPWGAQIPGYADIMAAEQDLDQMRVMGPRSASVEHRLMSGVYKCSDIGLFPNRCEAGTNLVMMEYMACGRPVIATYATGHTDVLEKFDCFNLAQSKPLTVRGPDGVASAEWVEPDLDEIIAVLEFAYHNRGELRWHGDANRNRMKRFTWRACAEALLKALEAPMLRERPGLDVVVE